MMGTMDLGELFGWARRQGVTVSAVEVNGAGVVGKVTIDTGTAGLTVTEPDPRVLRALNDQLAVVNRRVRCDAVIEQQQGTPPVFRVVGYQVGATRFTVEGRPLGPGPASERIVPVNPA